MDTGLRGCCFTGHRPEKLKRPVQEITADMEREVVKAVSAGVTVFNTGMAKGTDIVAGEVVLRLRDKGYPICLVCAIPYQGFEKSWSKEWKQRYHSIIDRADDIHYICPQYFRGCFQQRNRWLVDHSELVIAVYNGSPGGTRNTIDYAKRKGIDVVRIDG